MGRFSVTIDDSLLAEVQEALETASKADTIRMALSETLRRKRLSEALGHRGRIGLDVDQETLRKLRSSD